MSDSSQGAGWWKASDGKWYPPESHPSYSAPTLPPMPPPTQQPAQSYTHYAQPAQPPRKRKKPWWRRWWAIALGAIIVIAVIAAIASPPEDEDSDADDDTAQVVNDGDNADVEEDAADEVEEPEPAAVGSRDNPVPLGQAATITMDTFGDADNSQWSIAVTGAGSDITQAVLAENQFNEPPEAGRVFYGVPVTLTLNSADKEPLSIFVNLSLEFFGPASLSIISDGLSEGCGVAPGEFDVLKEVFVGGSISGTVCYSVTNEDAAAGVMLTTDDIEGDRLFLATR